jgi:hypothetical protein
MTTDKLSAERRAGRRKLMLARAGKPNSEASKQKLRETYARKRAAGLPLGRPKKDTE